MGISYDEIEHAPVGSCEESLAFRGQAGWSGASSKCILLKAKGKYYLLVTTAEKEIKARLFKKEFGTKDIRFANRDELMEVTGCDPGSVPPFGHRDPSLPFYVDENILREEHFMFNPAIPTKSFRIRTGDLHADLRLHPQPRQHLRRGRRGALRDPESGEDLMNQNKPEHGDIHAHGFFGPEPMTVLTDVLLAAAAVFFGVKIYGVSAAPVHFYFALSFFLIALGALAGATIHAIRHTSLVSWVPLLWRITGIAVGTSVTAMLAATFYHLLPADYADLLRWTVLGLSIIYAAWIWRDYRFQNVIVFYSICMAFVLGAMGLSYVSTGSPGAKLIAVGILISFGAAAVQRSGFKLARHFNHNDIYHVIQLIGLYFFYRGALLL